MAAFLQLVRGASIAGVLASLLMAVSLIAGWVEGAAVVVFLAAAVAAGVFAAIPASRDPMAYLGAVSVGAAGALLGLTTGLGALEIAAIAGAVLALPMVRPWDGWAGLLPPPWMVGGLGVGVAVLALVPLVLGGETLGHDESAYALKGRAWLEGTPDTGWSLHRGPALSAYAYLVLAIGGAEPALRAVGPVSVLALAVASWWLGARIGGRWVGAVSAVGVVAGPAMLRRGTELLTDIPASALLVVCMVIVWRDLADGEGPTYRLLWVLPFAWLAFYLRYQALLSFGLIGLAILVLWWHRITERPGPLIVGALVGLAGLIPHVVFSVSETGSPIGILIATGAVAGRQFIGEGIVDYAALTAWPLAGFVGPVAVGLFLWWVVSSWDDRLQRRRALFLLIPAAGQVLALGLLAHGESRFVFFPLALTVVGAATGLFQMARGWRAETARVAGAVLAVLLMGSLALSIGGVRRSVDSRILLNEPVELASEEIDRIDPGESCAVMTSYLPQVTYYSMCSTEQFRSSLEPDTAVERLEGEAKFMLLIEDGKRQPAGDHLAELTSLTSGSPVAIDGERYDAWIYPFDP